MGLMQFSSNFVHSIYEAWWYNTEPEDNMALVVATFKDRYPESGWVLNKECNFYLFVVEGEGQIGIKGKKAKKIATGNLFIIKKNEMYYFEPTKGSEIKFFSISTPKFEYQKHLNFK